MKRAEKAERIAKILDRLHPAPAVPLAHEDPFTLLVSVVLSAQCTDARVNEVTPGLFALARTPEAMARLPVATIERAIRACGLAPTKARNLQALSRELVARFGGRVPDELEALESLPGVGHGNAARRPGKKPKAKPLFERADRVAERRLRHLKLRCRLREAALPRHGDESSQIVHVLAAHS